MFENDSVVYCYVIAIALVLIFIGLGQVIVKGKHILEQFIVGSFVYFSIFHCFAFPMTLYGAKLSTLSIVWIVVVCVIVICLIRHGNYRKCFERWNLHLDQHEMLYLLIAVLLFLYIWNKSMYATGGVGWDTSHYIGSIYNAVYTDTLYQYNGAEGTKLETLNLHFAPCSFYMHSAVLCKIFQIHPLLVQRYTIGAVAVLLAMSIIYKMISLILKDRRKSLLAFAVAELLMFYYYTSYTGPFFLMNRVVEAKAWCAMIIYPGLAWALLKLYQDTEKKNWLYVFLIGFASVPISMSSLVGTPVMILAVTIVLMLRDKKWKHGLYGIACMVPNGVYCLMYLAFIYGMLRIEVR